MPTLQEILSLRVHCLDSEPYSQERKEQARKVVGQPRNISSFLEGLSYPWLTNCKTKSALCGKMKTLKSLLRLKCPS